MQATSRGFRCAAPLHFGAFVWLLGTDHIFGSYGYFAVRDRVHMHDLHATMPDQLGINHERWTYPYAGRNFRLTDVYGRVVEGILES